MKTMTMTLEQIKDDLREQAPMFAKEIAPVYKLLNLTWGQDLFSPKAHEIEKVLLGLINDLYFNDFGEANAETGRLIVWANAHDRSYGIKFEYDYSHYVNRIEV